MKYKPRHKASRRAFVIQTYLVAFMLVLGFVAYMSFTQPLPTREPDFQEIINPNIPRAQPGPPPTATPVAHGEAFTLMRIPRFGSDWLWTTLEGVSEDVVAKGPGHYPETKLPGQEGNVAFAAHRATHGDPFIDFDTLVAGDEIVLLQPGAEWVYTVLEPPEIIEANERWVLDDFAPGEWLTLTTCWPKYGAEKRMYVRAQLTDWSSYDEGS